MSASTPRPPRISGFTYVRPLGSGGFAQVYLYEQDIPRRVVAVKVLGGGATEPAALRSAFESEADVMARLSSHPSIVSIFQASISQEGLPYLAMEFCPASMGAQTKGRPAPLEQVLDAGVRIAGALETAHRARVLHRDIKPSNVLITTLGRPVLSDFGIALVADQAAAADARAAMSIPWSAPEVVQLESTGSVSSEVWSLGATLYSFAAGRSPFEKPERAQNSREKLTARIARAAYTPVPDARGYEPFDAVLQRALAARAEDRFASMAAFGEALQELQRGYGFDVTPLEVVADGWIPRATPAESGVRGPAISEVAGRRTRAEARAELRAQHLTTDSDGVVYDRPPMSPMRAGLIGAAIGAAGSALILVGTWALLGGLA